MHQVSDIESQKLIIERMATAMDLKYLLCSRTSENRGVLRLMDHLKRYSENYVIAYPT